MAISRLKGSGRFGQVLQGRDLAVNGLETVLSGSTVATGDGFAQISAAPLKTQLAAFGSRISTEYTRAVAAEGTLTSNLAAEVSANNTDHAAATTDRALIRTENVGHVAQVSASLSSQLSLVRGNAALAYNDMGKLEDKIQLEQGRVDAILNAADADYDTFAETVALINSVDTTNDNAFAAHVATYNAYVTSNDAALAAEVTANNADHLAATADRAAVRTEFAAADTALGVLIASHEAQLDDSFLSVSASAGCTLSFGTAAPQLKLVPDGAYIKLELSYKA